MRLAITIAAAVFLSALIHSADWAATRVLWLAAALLLLGFAGLVLYHRRKVAELRELHSETTGHWRRVNRLAAWPKECLSCGSPAYSWRAVGAHGDPGRSACAAHVTRLERAEAAPETWSATVSHGAGAGSVDTLTDDQRPELEARQ
jgi:hypothetical protein